MNVARRARLQDQTSERGDGLLCVALTCEAGPGDCLALFGTLDVIKPGDVVVVKADSFTRRQVIGDLLLGMMKNNGAAARSSPTDWFVMWPGIIGVGIPTFSAGVTPNSPAKSGPGTVGLPIVVGGLRSMPATLSSAIRTAW